MPTSYKLKFKKFSEFDQIGSTDIFDSTNTEQNIRSNYYVVGYYQNNDDTINYRIPLSDLSTAMRKHLHIEFEMHENDAQPTKGEEIPSANVGYEDGKLRVDKIHLFPAQAIDGDNPDTPDDNLLGVYNEWIIVSKGDKYYWESLGQAKIDLSEYTKVEPFEINISLADWKSLQNNVVVKYYKHFTPTEFDENSAIFNLKNKKIKDILRTEEVNTDGSTEIVVPNLIVIGPNDNEFSLDMTVTDIYGNKTFALHEGKKLRITLLYAYKEETAQTN